MKTKLNYTTEKVITEQEWSGFVTEVYGRPYCLQQQEDCYRNGSSEYIDTEDDYDYEAELDDVYVSEEVNGPQMGTTFKNWLARDPKKPLRDKYDATSVTWDLELWYHRNFYPTLQTVVKDLFKRGLIEPGVYRIDISW